MNPDPLSCDEIEAMWLSDLGSFGCIAHGENITQLGLDLKSCCQMRQVPIYILRLLLFISRNEKHQN